MLWWCVCRGDVRGEPHRPVLLGTGPPVAAQLHLQVQSHHRRGEEKTVPPRVPQRLPTGGHIAQVGADTDTNTHTHTHTHTQHTNGAKKRPLLALENQGSSQLLLMAPNLTTKS